MNADLDDLSSVFSEGIRASSDVVYTLRVLDSNMKKLKVMLSKDGIQPPSIADDLDEDFPNPPMPVHQVTRDH